MTCGFSDIARPVDTFSIAANAIARRNVDMRNEKSTRPQARTLIAGPLVR
jgi:hypothetical protein